MWPPWRKALRFKKPYLPPVCSLLLVVVQEVSSRLLLLPRLSTAIVFGIEALLSGTINQKKLFLLQIAFVRLREKQLIWPGPLFPPRKNRVTAVCRSSLDPISLPFSRLLPTSLLYQQLLPHKSANVPPGSFCLQKPSLRFISPSSTLHPPQPSSIYPPCGFLPTHMKAKENCRVWVPIFISSGPLCGTPIHLLRLSSQDFVLQTRDDPSTSCGPSIAPFAWSL